MRKMYMFMMLSLDGYFEGPNHDLSWHRVDEEFDKFAIEMLKGADIHVFGRRMYQLMESFWPKAEHDPKTAPDDVIVAHYMNTTPKIVFSRTLAEVKETDTWKNVTLMREFDEKEMRKLKEQPGNGIWVGGPELASNFIKAGLIDEFWFMINPVIIGKGTSISKWLDKELSLQLIQVRTFKNGNVLLYYKPKE